MSNPLQTVNHTGVLKELESQQHGVGLLSPLHVQQSDVKDNCQQSWKM
jgi:hypothetical protein